MTTSDKHRSLALALVLSGGLHGLLVLLLCASRGPIAGAVPAAPIVTYVRYVASPVEASPLFVIRHTPPTAPPPDPKPLEVCLPDNQVTPPPPPVAVVIPSTKSGEGNPSPQRGSTPPERQGNQVNSGQGGAVPRTNNGLFASGTGARSVVFVLDRSLSMGVNGGLRKAREEVCACLTALQPTACFQVVPYDDAREASPLTVDGRRTLLPADPFTVAAAVAQVTALRARGGTNHLAGLRCGLGLRPEVLYFVTDADDFDAAAATAALRLNLGHALIHVVHLTTGVDRDDNLRRLATASGGTYRKISPDRR